MHTLTYRTLDRDLQQLRLSDLETLAAQIRGGALGPGNDAYNEARKVLNGNIDRHPALIARCPAASDVQAAVRIAALEQHAAGLGYQLQPTVASAGPRLMPPLAVLFRRNHGSSRSR